MTITPTHRESVDLEQLFVGCYAMNVVGDGFAAFMVCAGDRLIVERRTARKGELMVYIKDGGVQLGYGPGECVAVVVGVVRKF